MVAVLLGDIVEFRVRWGKVFPFKHITIPHSEGPFFGKPLQGNSPKPKDGSKSFAMVLKALRVPRSNSKTSHSEYSDSNSDHIQYHSRVARGTLPLRSRKWPPHFSIVVGTQVIERRDVL